MRNQNKIRLTEPDRGGDNGNELNGLKSFGIGFLFGLPLPIVAPLAAFLSLATVFAAASTAAIAAQSPVTGFVAGAATAGGLGFIWYKACKAGVNAVRNNQRLDKMATVCGLVAGAMTLPLASPYMPHTVPNAPALLQEKRAVITDNTGVISAPAKLALLYPKLGMTA